MITGKIVETQQGRYVTCGDDCGVLGSAADILSLLGWCYEAGSNRILLPASHLHPDFFDLSTGLAGEIGLKLTTYAVKTAVHVNPAAITSQRFHEWMAECNRSGQIRFFDNITQAEAWLVREKRP